MSKEPFTIQMDRLVLVMGRDVVVDLGAQLRAHDPSLPETLEEQIRELMARPTALDFMRAMPSTESLLGGIANNIERPLTASDSAIVIATLDELYRAIVTSIMPPSPPPPPPPTKAVEGES